MINTVRLAGDEKPQLEEHKSSCHVRCLEMCESISTQTRMYFAKVIPYFVNGA